MATTSKTGERVTLSVIREAYFDGDYELCLTRCDAFPTRDVNDAAEIVLLRARCLVQLRRGDHAIEVLRGLRLRDDQHDEYLIGRMLLSAAYVALGRYDQGLKIAREAYDEIGDAHATVRAELTLNLAAAHYRKGEYAQVSRLLNAIPAADDIVYVRALQFRGAIAWAHANFAGSLDKFHDALARLDRCQYRDRFLESSLLYSLTLLCGELPRLDLWPEVLKRIERFDWSVSGVALSRYWIAIEASFITEMLGDLSASTAWARQAEETAPDAGAKIGAWLRLAARFGRNGEKGAHEYFTDKAMLEYDKSCRDARQPEQWLLSLDIAEEVLYSDSPSSASRLVTYYAEAIAPDIRSIKVGGRTIEARYAQVTGLLEESRRNRARAEESYKSAFDTICSTGLMRGAAIVAYRLFALTGENEYEKFIAEVLRDASDRYWVKARLIRSRTEARLTTKQLEIVRLVAQGLSNKEIASARKISVSRARNALAEIFALFDVRSRTELATVAAARGLLDSAE